MLALTKKTDYALIALWHLGRHEDQVCSAREVADVHGVPLPILTNVLKQLTRAGLVTSVRGSKGGYTLGKPAAAISLHDLVEVIEGPFGLVTCMGEGEGISCELEGCCPIREPMRRIHERMRDFLKSVTLSEIVSSRTCSVTVSAGAGGCGALQPSAVEEMTS